MSCGKTIYSTQLIAEEAVRGIRKDRRAHHSKKKPCTTYFCADCKAWHITSNKVKPHAPRSLTVQVNTTKAPDYNRYLKIKDFTQGYIVNMGRFSVLLLSLVILAGTASGFSDSRVKKMDKTFQVNDDLDFGSSICFSSNLVATEFVVPQIFVLEIPFLGRPEEAMIIEEVKSSIEIIPVIRPPPGSNICQKSDYNISSK
jgi:hypothetical protein